MKKSDAWNKGIRVGQKPALTVEQAQLIKMLLTQAGNLRNLALFCLSIDSSLRGCDLVSLRVQDLSDGQEMYERATITQQKTSASVSFSMSPHTREAVRELIASEDKTLRDYLFTGQRKGQGKAITPTHYRRLVKGWLEQAGINSVRYGSHSLRRAKVAFVYRETGNLRAVQVLLGHKSIENTKNYLGIDRDEALSIGEKFHGIF